MSIKKTFRIINLAEIPNMNGNILCMYFKKTCIVFLTDFYLKIRSNT